MILRVLSVVMGLAVTVLPVAAQTPSVPAGNPKAALFVGIGWGHVAIGADDGFGGGRPNVGGTVMFVPIWPLAIEADFHRNLGRTGKSGQYGSASLVSANVTYYFGRDGAHPFVSAGIGGFWSSEQVFLVRPNTILAWNVGAGALIPITRTISVRPDLRAYKKSELWMIRPSIAVGYTWK